MITFGLTGGIACGKSTASKTFKMHGIPMVDADIVAREVVEIGRPGWLTIRDQFGCEFLNEDQTIDRLKLGNLVFKDAGAMDVLNGIMKPLIEAESSAQLKKLHDEGHAIVGYDAALICEMGNADKFRPLVVVVCAPWKQLERLMSRNSLTVEQAMHRISAQMPAEQKVKMANFVINTNGSIENSIKQTEKIIQKLKEYNEAHN